MTTLPGAWLLTTSGVAGIGDSRLGRVVSQQNDMEDVEGLAMQPLPAGGCARQVSVSVRDGQAAAVVIGPAAVTERQLRAALLVHRTVESWVRFVASVAGSHVCIARTLDSGLIVQASGVAADAVYYTRHVNEVVVSNSCIELAHATGRRDLNLDVVAAHLFEAAPSSVASKPLFRGVDVVPVGHALVINNGKDVALHKAWTPFPVEHLSLSAAAERVADAVSGAVGARFVSGIGSVACDLSGGMDSTSLAFVSAQHSTDLTLYTLGSNDRVSSDVQWARRAAAQLPHLRHVVAPADDVPGEYDSLHDYIVPLDTPTFAHASAAKFVHPLRMSHGDGMQAHLTGHGGDQLFTGVPTWVYDSVRRTPWRAWPQLASLTATRNWRWGDAFGAVLRDNRSHERWWADEIASITQPPPRHYPLVGWAQPCRLRQWVTAEGVHRAAAGLRMELDAGPAFATRGQCAAFEAVLAGGRLMRSMAQIARSSGQATEVHAPFLDHAVVSAALSADSIDSVTATSYKPLLRTAMAPTVPPIILSRVSKDNGSQDAENGLHDNRDTLCDLWSDSRLGSLGIVDDKQLKTLCNNPSRPELADGALWSTLGVELWLRGLEEVAQ